MEIVHAAVGFARFPVSSTLMQVSSRLCLVWALSRLALSVRLPAYGRASWSCLATLSCTQPVRRLAQLPFFLRYHIIMLFDPSGVPGEVICMVSSLSFLSTGAYAFQLPNTHNISISLYVVVILVLVVYIPGLLVMYSHMLTQRNRAYSKTQIKTASSRMRQDKNENWQEAIVC
uniref:very-long-chain (3R)-3-hydroxyacyl-CoA dehydratase n=1 Tax=Peronospora matthiolae TaxID=2874970 RepID=A0AAV1TMV9_9STRA